MQNKVLNRKSEIEETVRQNTDSITKLIKPQDLSHQNITDWEDADIDALEMELAENMSHWTYPNDHPYTSEIENLAIDLYLKECVRIPMEHLNSEEFRGKEDAINEGYWLNSLSYREARELVYRQKSDTDFFYEYEREAIHFVENIVLDEQMKELKE